MPDPTSPDDQLRRALAAIRQLKAKVAQAQSGAREPIAIVGLGVRFPGEVTTPAELWTLLQAGRDATSEVPAARWDREIFYDPNPEAQGKISTQRGGFLADVEHFDPQHFGLAPAEVPHLDPQHRLLLETSWEAMEDAAIAPDGLTGESVGTFIGISSSDYAQRLFEQGVEAIDPYVGSGNAHSVAAGRIAYTLGFQGPAVAIDTACSSSLVAVHLACQSLRSQETHLALAGGVNLQLSPLISVNHSRARMLSPDGRCKAFGDQADGFGRADGCGMIVLKRLSDAQRDEDRILAVIRGSATNQDGRTSGLTVPNGQAQQAVIRAALAQAQLPPEAIDYIEAHGTGTSLGDPIEAHALGAVFAGRSDANPLWLGSIKSNFGHCEAAAGIAGLIKVVLALQHQTLPIHLHASPPSTRIDWSSLPLQIVSTAQPWAPRENHVRTAGVSSFGFGGTNAHIVVAEAPAAVEPTIQSGEEEDLLPLSARTPDALGQLANRLLTHVQTHADRWSDISFTLAVGRASFAYRALIPKSADFTALRNLADHPSSALLVAESPRIAFMFSGQGSLTLEAGLKLRETVPAFRNAFDAAAAIVQQQAGWQVAEVLADTDRIKRTEYGQVTLFCISYALARTWQQWGIEPAVVLGHSVGEYAAACVAGALTLEDALSLLIARAQAMGALGEHGAMVAVSADPAIWETTIQTAGAEIGAYNAPQQFVVTGNRPAVTACAEALAAQGLPTTPLSVKQGYHSRDMEPMIDAFRTAAAEIPFQSLQCEFISSVSGKLEEQAIGTADYWARQIRQPVRWRDAVATLSQQGIDLVIELGPGGMLTALSQHTWSSSSATWLASLRGKTREAEAASLRTAATRAWQRGAAIDWQAVHAGRKLCRRRLPTYPFERQRYWPESAVIPAAAYRLIAVPVSANSTIQTLPATWHLVGDLSDWHSALRAQGNLVVSHAKDATPLALQPHLGKAENPHRVLVRRDHPAASLWIGAAKVLALEYPSLWGGLTTLPPDLEPASAVNSVGAQQTAPVVHWQQNGGTTSQLEIDALPTATWTARPNVTYVITGGLGALGLHFARWLSDRGATALLLMGRRKPQPEVEKTLEALRARGVEISTAQVDVTNRDQLETALKSPALPVGGIIHAAGVGDFTAFATMTESRWEETTSAKVIGAALLDELCSSLDLDLFVLCSSISSVWGSQGQAHYAAANQVLDDLAARRHTRGDPALAVNWGPWADGGMATPEAAKKLTEIGIGLMAPAAALATFEAALVAGRSQVVIAQVRWEQFRETYELRGPSLLLQKMPARRGRDPSLPSAGSQSPLALQLDDTPPEKISALLLHHVESVVSQVLKLPPGQKVSPHQGFADLGIDSLMAIELRRQLSADLGTDFATTLVFDHPDCERLAVYLQTQWQKYEDLTADSNTSSHSADAEAEAELNRKLTELGI